MLSLSAKLFHLDEVDFELRDASRLIGLLVEVSPLLLGQVDVVKDSSGFSALFFIFIFGYLKKFSF
jgi:hypothetical protein